MARTSAPSGSRAEPAPDPASELRIAVVVPVYNNERTVRRVVEGALAQGHPVIVVDDGSEDASATTLSGLPVELERQPRNLGKGAALVRGARRALELGATHVLTLDADGQFSASDMPRLVGMARAHPRSIVLGARAFVPGVTPRASRFGRWFSNQWVRIIAGARVADSQSGFRLYPIETLTRTDLRARRYDMEVEVLIRSAWEGREILSVPVSVTYAPPEGLVSSFRPWADNARISLTYARLFLRSMLLLPGPETVGATPGAPETRLSVWHPVRLVRALLRERSSPSQLAASASLGLVLATLPLIGFHTLAVLLAATALRLNRLMAFAVSHLCAPPFVPALCLWVGYATRHGRWIGPFEIGLLFREIPQRFVDYLVGTLVVAPILGALGGLITFAIARVAREIPGGAPAPQAEVAQRARAYGNAAGVGFFRWVVRALGVRSAYFCLWFVVPYYVWFRPAVRRSLAPYVTRRFPGAGPIRRHLESLRVLVEFGRTLVDQGALRARGKEYFRVTIAERERLRQLLGGERGTVLLMTHAGSWTMLLPYLDVVPKPIHFLMNKGWDGPSLLAWDDPEVKERFRVIDTSAPLGGLIDATAALQRGGIVTLMGDRPWGGRTFEATFLGAPVRLLQTPYKLARATSSNLVALIARREGHRAFRIEFRDLSGTEADRSRPETELNREQAAGYLSQIEDLLCHNPHCWFNFFDFWAVGDDPLGATGARREPTEPVGHAPSPRRELVPPT